MHVFAATMILFGFFCGQVLSLVPFDQQQQISTLKHDANDTGQGEKTALPCTKNSNGTDDCKSFGYYCTINGTCQCRKAPTGFVDCSDDGFALRNEYCANFDEEEIVVQFGACIFIPGCVPGVTNASKHGVQSQQYCCKDFGRTGTLCGRCLPDHYLLAYSFGINCIPFPNAHWNWVKYIVAAYLPLTLFYFIVVLPKINILSGLLNPVVLFSQGMSLTPISRAFLIFAWKDSHFSAGINIALTLYGIWNLDFFRPYYSDLCLGIGILPTLALDYAIAVYPLLLMTVSYLLILLYDRDCKIIIFLSRPFRVFRRNWDVKTSIVDSFSAFFLLSNIKFLS